MRSHVSMALLLALVVDCNNSSVIEDLRLDTFRLGSKSD